MNPLALPFHPRQPRRSRSVAGLLAVIGLLVSAATAGAHEGALVYTGPWEEHGCFTDDVEQVTICHDLEGLVHVSAAPSGAISLSHQTGGHFVISVDGTIVQDETFDSRSHLLLLEGDLQQANLVYRFSGVYRDQACEGRWMWTIADGELRFDGYSFNCVTQ